MMMTGALLYKIFHDVYSKQGHVETKLERKTIIVAGEVIRFTD